MARPKTYDVEIVPVRHPNFDVLISELERCSEQREECWLCPASTQDLCQFWWDHKGAVSPLQHAVDISTERLDRASQEFGEISNGQWPEGMNIPRKE